MLEMKINDYKWRVIPYESSSASWNAAIDHALLEVMKERVKSGENVTPVLRTYQFSRGTITLGYGQNGSNFDRSKLNGYDITTRISGGGHMFISPRDVNYCTILPRSLAPEDLIGSYRMLNEPIANALRELGFNARIGRTSIKVDTTEEKTLVGVAQKAGNGVLLQHGSILFDDYTKEIFDILNADEEEIKVWKEKIIALSMINGKVDPVTIAKEIERQFQDKSHSQLDQRELEVAKRLYESTYNNPEVVGMGPKIRDHICILEGLMTKNYQTHLEDNSGLENDTT
ncbi:MAG: hypothetical protein CMH64_04810 [Nanoarchaeota archaeon]|nr:hypothetical protein [Nanoarchaeota archaeon]|tara:strand:- start:154 stop:1011 length:858 start_codon:yes stop_codon:yes gene_type:complete